MALQVSTKGVYDGYQTTVTITGTKGKSVFSSKQNVAVFYDITSDDGGSPATCQVTLYNISKTHLAKIQQRDHIVVETGPADLFGTLTEGNISKIAPEVLDGRDKETVITFVEGPDYSKDKRLYSKFNGSKLVKKSVKAGGKTVTYTKRQVKRLNITFKKGVKAKQIINRIKRDAKIDIPIMRLKKDHVYKHGYTLSKKPYDALTAIAKDCGSVIFYRKGKLVIDDKQKENLFSEHLYLTLGNGLISEPVPDDGDDGTSTWTLDCFEDPRIAAGSWVYVKSTNLNGLYRVKSVEHTHDHDTYTMEVTIYA